MGLKSGSRDSELDEDETNQSASQESSTDGTRSHPSETGRTSEGSEHSTAGLAEENDRSEPSGSDSRPAVDSLPYKLRRDKVNEGREQVPYFLRKEIIDAESDLQDSLEELLGEDVYKSDYREAAMVVAQRNPQLVAEVLREWGYDLDAV